MATVKRRRTNRAARRKDAAATRAARKHAAHARQHAHQPAEEEAPRGFFGWLRKAMRGLFR